MQSKLYSDQGYLLSSRAYLLKINYSIKINRIIIKNLHCYSIYFSYWYLFFV